MAGEGVKAGGELFNFEKLVDFYGYFLRNRKRYFGLKSASLEIKMRHFRQNFVTQLDHQLGSRIDRGLVVIPNQVAQVPAQADGPVKTFFWRAHDKTIRVIGASAVQIHVLIFK